MFLDPKAVKAKKELKEIWNSMEMNCANNYKDQAQADLKLYEQTLTQYYEQALISQKDCAKYQQQLNVKKNELKFYDHKQRIGW